MTDPMTLADLTSGDKVFVECYGRQRTTLHLRTVARVTKTQIIIAEKTIGDERYCKTTGDRIGARASVWDIKPCLKLPTPELYVAYRQQQSNAVLRRAIAGLAALNVSEIPTDIGAQIVALYTALSLTPRS